MDYRFIRSDGPIPPSSDEWLKIKPLIPSAKKFLEIGVCEGRSIIWTAETLMQDGSEITCVDCWDPEYNKNSDMSDIESNFDHNMEILKELRPDISIIKEKSVSYDAIARYMVEGKKFDYIYIDSNHSGKGIMVDAAFAWQVLEVGGVMMFDDYYHDQPRDPVWHAKMAIKTFALFFQRELDVIHRGKRFIIQKKSKPLLGGPVDGVFKPTFL